MCLAAASQTFELRRNEGPESKGKRSATARDFQRLFLKLTQGQCAPSIPTGSERPGEFGFGLAVGGDVRLPSFTCRCSSALSTFRARAFCVMAAVSALAVATPSLSTCGTDSRHCNPPSSPPAAPRPRPLQTSTAGVWVCSPCPRPCRRRPPSRTSGARRSWRRWRSSAARCVTRPRDTPPPHLSVSMCTATHNKIRRALRALGLGLAGSAVHATGSIDET